MMTPFHYKKKKCILTMSAFIPKPCLIFSGISNFKICFSFLCCSFCYNLREIKKLYFLTKLSQLSNFFILFNTACLL